MRFFNTAGPVNCQEHYCLPPWVGLIWANSKPSSPRRNILLVLWPVPGALQAVQRIVIELKVLYGSLEHTIADGLAQTWAYADQCQADEAHLVVFDRRPQRSWEERVFRQERMHLERSITVWGM